MQVERLSVAYSTLVGQREPKMGLYKTVGTQTRKLFTVRSLG